MILEKLAQKPPISVSLLYWSWGGLGSSIGLLLLSFLLSVQIMHTNKDKIDEELRGRAGFKEYTRLENKLIILRKSVNCLNWATFVAFVLGVILLLQFVIQNLTP